MATTSYDLFFGSQNTGGAPSFSTFVDASTNAPIVPPAITELSGGFYRFVVDWGLVSAVRVRYAAACNAVEVSDEIAANPVPASMSVQAGTQNPGLYDTALTILGRASVQLGLGRIQGDAYASTDPNIQQLCEFLRQVGDDLSKEHDWTNLVRPCSFTTDGASMSYLLPADFHDFMDDTGWNRSQRMPLVGPVSPQERAYLQARLPGVILNVIFSIQGGLLTFPVVPPTGAVVAFEYQSSYWVMSAGNSTPDKGDPTANDDLLLYDSDLILAALKLRYGEEKGIGDVVAYRARYDEKLEHAIGKNMGGSILSLGAGSVRVSDRMIDGSNVPLGNW
jgi:hypothetical protein